MFNRAVNAFRKGIHRKSAQSASYDEELYVTTEDEEDEDANVIAERMSIRSTTSCSFRKLEHSQSGTSSGILSGSVQTSEGI